MNFAAIIIQGSPIDRLWRAHRRLSGDIHGVRFRLAGTLNAGVYCAREVTADRVFMLQNNQSIQLEAMGTAPPPVREPEETAPVPIGEPPADEPNADDGEETNADAAPPEPGAAAPRRRGRPPKSAPAQE